MRTHIQIAVPVLCAGIFLAGLWGWGDLATPLVTGLSGLGIGAGIGVALGRRTERRRALQATEGLFVRGDTVTVRIRQPEGEPVFHTVGSLPEDAEL